jgi:hypothetical protein
MLDSQKLKKPITFVTGCGYLQLLLPLGQLVSSKFYRFNGDFCVAAVSGNDC